MAYTRDDTEVEEALTRRQVMAARAEAPTPSSGLAPVPVTVPPGTFGPDGGQPAAQAPADLSQPAPTVLAPLRRERLAGADTAAQSSPAGSDGPEDDAAGTLLAFLGHDQATAVLAAFIGSGWVVKLRSGGLEVEVGAR